jgi:hypothetical protein
MAGLDEDLFLTWLRRTRGAPSERERVDVGRPARHRDLDRVRADLRRLGITTQLRFVWSGDGSGVEEDDPHVIHIHRPLVRAAGAPRRAFDVAERAVALDIASVARHEIGHALLFLRPRLARGAAFKRLFGDVGVAYRVGNPVDEVTRRLDRHRGFANPRYRRVVSLYAATHPHESFAEAVRIAMAARGDESRLRSWAEGQGKAPIVAEQLLFAARWLRDYG